MVEERISPGLNNKKILEFLTTVQHRGQNHHMKRRASRRNNTSSVISRMVPSNWTTHTQSRSRFTTGEQLQEKFVSSK